MINKEKLIKLLFISVSSPALRDLSIVQTYFNKKYKTNLKISAFYVGRETTEKTIHDKALISCKSSDMIFLDTMGANKDFCDELYNNLINFKGNIAVINSDSLKIRKLNRLGSFSLKNMKMTGKKSIADKEAQMGKILKMMNMMEKLSNMIPVGPLKDARNNFLLFRYWQYAEKENMENMLLLVLKEYFKIPGLPSWRKPTNVGDAAISDFAGNKTYKRIAAYVKAKGYNNKKPNILIFFYNNSYPTYYRKILGEIVESLEKISNPIPVGFLSLLSKSTDTIRKQIQKNKNIKIDLIINIMPFRLGAGPMGGNAEKGIKFLKELDVPLLHPVILSKTTIEEWGNSPKGINPSEFLISVMLPELDGAIEPIIISALSELEEHESTGVSVDELVIIKERLNKLILRINSWLKLRKTNNKDKKIALILFNYPPGESSFGNAAFLDSLKSIENILKRLKKEGYYCNEISSEELLNLFVQKGIVNSGKWTLKNQYKNFIHIQKRTYKNYFTDYINYAEIEKEWGKSPGSIMADGKDILIPAIINKNILIALQPSRGIKENDNKVYHDRTIPPHHQYVSFYKWIENEFKANAIIHVGTHGTLELLPGKELMLSERCYPDYLIGKIPHFYLYYCGNPSEAMIAKRRSYSVNISYHGPNFIKSGLYEELSELEALISEFRESQKVDPQRSSVIYKQINKLCKKMNIENSTLEDIEKELYEIKMSLIPEGLHAFGEQMGQNEYIDFVISILSYGRGDIKSITRCLAELKGYSYEDITKNYTDKKNKSIVEEIEDQSKILIRDYIKNRKITIHRYRNSKDLKKTLEFGCNAYKRASQCDELGGLVRALSGKFIKARLSGDYIRNPEVFPTGYNMYQFDPRLVPSKSALERGTKIADDTIKYYYQKYKKYPNSIAIILWGLETAKTHGETIGQIFKYIGVRPSDKGEMWNPQYEIIPLSELKRPRIDVVINICGFFRDMFPNLITDLSNIFSKISSLNEPLDMNFIKSNTLKLKRQLHEEKHKEDDIAELSSARIFGPKNGEYGTGVTEIVSTKNWNNENQLVESYLLIKSSKT
jgi:cobaltochelatase CobN